MHLRRALGPVHVTLLGIGAIIGAGIFATIGTAAAGDAARPGAGPSLDALVRPHRRRLRVHRALLRRVRLDGADLRLGLHLRLRDPGRARRLDHRLGPDHRVRGRQRRRGHLLGQLLPHACSRGSGSAFPTGCAPTTGPRRRIPGLFESAPHLFGVPDRLQPAVACRHRRPDHHRPRLGDPRVGAASTRSWSCIKIVVLLFFIGVAIYFVPPARQNWTPFPPNGWAGICAGAAIVFFAYIGFDAVSTVAEETREPDAATCRSASSRRWSSARSSTSWSPRCSPASCRTRT